MSKTNPRNQIRVAVFPTTGLPYIAIIDNNLKTFQSLVKGYIEMFPTRLDGVVGVCDEEGLFHGEGPNLLSIPFGAQICGTFVLCSETFGPDGIDFASLSDAHVRAIENGPCWPTPQERAAAERDE